VAKRKRTAKKKAKADEKPRQREAKGVGVLTIPPGSQRGGRAVGRSRRAFSASRAKRHPENPDPPPSYFPKGPIKIKAKSDLTGL
jgi:hypothetical protein